MCGMTLRAYCVAVTVLSLTSCAIADTRKLTSIKGESVVLSGTEPAYLLAGQMNASSVVVRSTHLPDQPKTVVYELTRDYVIDFEKGTISRTAESRIPDFSTNVLYGQKDFDHSKFPGYGNLPFTVYVDYTAADVPQIAPEPVDVSELLPKTVNKLRAGDPLKVIAYGDSITAGGEASSVELQFTPRWIAETLRKRYPNSHITFENGATGGDTTEQGIARLEEKVLTRQPDLVLVAFGMNDHNVGSVDLPRFKENLRTMVKQIREKTGAEVILLSTFPPHPDWHFGSHRMEKYAAATKEVAGEVDAPYADVYGVYEAVLKRKDPSSLLANNINHPNDFGHWLFVVALDSLTF
jgi:acyl-CoA thioesterase I